MEHAGSRTEGDTMSVSPHTDTAELLIRPAFPDDDRELMRLAELDEASVPPAPLLVAEVEGELRAAVSLTTLEAIANPFRPTAELTALLCQRAVQLGARSPRRGWRRTWHLRHDHSPAPAACRAA
jgi:hypothetical protein